MLTITVALRALADGATLDGIAGQFKVAPTALRHVLQRLAAAADGSAANAPPRCLHGATPDLCAFAGCEHFKPDGPREERWAFALDATAEDIAAALAENAAQHHRAPGSASPIHLVVERYRRERIAR